MKLHIAGIAIALLVFPAYGDDDPEGHQSQLGYLSASYILIGKKLDSDDTFLGRMVLAQNGSRLEGYREIEGVRVAVSGTIKHPRCCESTHVLRLRFAEGDHQLEGTYLWRGDLDNYARISGYVYERGTSTMWPGMEVLFRDHRTK